MHLGMRTYYFLVRIFIVNGGNEFYSRVFLRFSPRKNEWSRFRVRAGKPSNGLWRNRSYCRANPAILSEIPVILIIKLI